ncbi:MAG: hypothetical protein ACLQPV_08230 [Vulcanimicrobiaceae bacterium]
MKWIIATAALIAVGSLGAACSAQTHALWSIGGLYVLPDQDDGQYQAPVFNGSAVTFNLTRNYNGTNNYRNQLNPLSAPGTLVFLPFGSTFEFQFQTLNNLGQDVQGSQNLIWQIHDYISASSPATTLGLQNLDGNGTVWYGISCGKEPAFTAPYVRGAIDNWDITVKIASDASGSAVYKLNGAVVGSCTGPTVNPNVHAPWWNFGIYEWDWKAGQPASQQSNLESQSVTFTSMTVSAK